LISTKIEVQEATENDNQERRMSVSGDDGEEGEEPSIVAEGEEEEISRGPGEVAREDIEGEAAHEEGREEAGETTCVSVSI
jgi:hypothetical protein